MARFISVGRSTSFTSTADTVMPHGSVRSSMIFLRMALIFSRSASSSSSSVSPSTAAQCRLGQLARGVEIILDLDDGAARRVHLHVQDRVHLDRDVVPGDHVLRRDVERHDAERHPLHLGQPQRHEGDARPPLPGELAEEKVHPTLVLLQNAKAPETVGNCQNRQRR
jgi:hypothetical protein